MAESDVAEADEASRAAWTRLNVERDTARIRAYLIAEVALARGDLGAARRWADQGAASTAGFHRMVALTTRVRVAIAQGEPEQAAQTGVPGILECLAGLARETQQP